MDKDRALELVGQIRKTAYDLNEILDEEDPKPQEDPTPDPESKPGPAYLIVGKGAAKPGEIANVEVLGTSPQPVQGFGAYVGCEAALELVSHEVLGPLITFLGMETPESLAVQSKRGGTGDFLSLMLAFFSQITGVVDPQLREIKGLRLPPMTPLMELQFRVPTSAVASKRYHLDNTSLKYGRRMSNGRGGSRTMRMQTVFGTSREVSRWGIEPVCISGWVDVL